MPIISDVGRKAWRVRLLIWSIYAVLGAGAVTMVEDLFAVDGTGQDEAVFKLASDVQVDQITEINRMQLMLDDMASQTHEKETS